MRERDRIADWIEKHCWSEEAGSFVMYPGTTRLDASLALAVRFGFDGRDRLRATLAAIDRELGSGPFHYRYSGAEKEEGCFLACSYWTAEAWALLDEGDKARERLDELDLALSHGSGVLSEIVDPDDRSFLGNMPQGLSHLAHLMALSTAYGSDDRPAKTAPSRKDGVDG